MKLDLIETIYGKYYWNMDENGVYAESADYETESRALEALFSNSIEWEYKEIVKNETTDNQ